MVFLHGQEQVARARSCRDVSLGELGMKIVAAVWLRLVKKAGCNFMLVQLANANSGFPVASRDATPVGHMSE